MRSFTITARKYCALFTCLYKTVEQLAISPVFISSINFPKIQAITGVSFLLNDTIPVARFTLQALAQRE
uniref:Uncharacterized protein n=1 Tax=Glossina palpalis gambiensis TaxID=67801 RepID=A0A1B0AMJ2_9MUSC